MIQSMTGYGKSVLQLPTKKVTIEIKSLNSKNLDLNVRIPSYYKEKELSVRKKLANALVRGKVDFSIFVEMTGNESSAKINHSLVKEYMEQLRNLVDPVKTSEVELLKMAIRSLEIDFKERITNIRTYLEEVKALDRDRVENVKTRLKKAIDDLKVDADENRFEQELIYYLEKLDINEEKVRLANHLDYFLLTLSSEVSNGKKLGFIVQEMGREINTTGSKANYAPMQKAVIQMKNELEQIKEQILNVL